MKAPSKSPEPAEPDRADGGRPVELAGDGPRDSRAAGGSAAAGAGLRLEAGASDESILCGQRGDLVFAS